MNNILKPLDENIGKLLASGYAMGHMMETRSRLDGTEFPKFEIQHYVSTKKEEFLVRLPCSQIKTDTPMRLFSINSTCSAGMVFDARDADFLYTAPNIIRNLYRTYNDKITIKEKSIFEETDDLQKTFWNVYQKLGAHGIPTDISEQKNKEALQALERSWELIAADQQGYYDRTNKLDGSSPMVTESLVNLKSVKNIKAVVYYAKTPELTKCKSPGYNGLFQAMFVQGVLELEFEHKVPLLFYEKREDQDLRPANIAEINLNEKTVEAMIAQSSQKYRATLKKYCKSALDNKVESEKKNNLYITGLLPNTSFSLGSDLVKVNRSPDHKTI